MTVNAEARHADEKQNDGMERLVFFSDGVFAIAITLLAIELHPPHDWDGTFSQLWSAGWREFAAYALSFALIGMFWNSHRRIFIQIRSYSLGVFALNIVLLGAIALMPFVTNLLYREGPANDAFLIYLGTVGFAGLVQGLMFAWAIFIVRTVDTSIHWARWATSVLSAAVLPAMISASTLSLYGALAGGTHSLWLSAVLFGAVFLIILLRAIAERRYAR
jgi:uncharacterized membrane protein